VQIVQRLPQGPKQLLNHNDEDVCEDSKQLLNHNDDDVSEDNNKDVGGLRSAEIVA